MERCVVDTVIPFTNESYIRCLPVWDRLGRDWRKLKRLEMDYGQWKSLWEKTVDSCYYSSRFLEHPSMGKFMVKLHLSDEPGMDIRVAFRPAQMEAADILQVEVIKGCVVVPLVDAYVYMDEKDTSCNFIMTFCRADAVEDGMFTDCILQFVPWYKDDFYTRTILFSNRKVFNQFAHQIILLFLGVQMLSLERRGLEAYEPKEYVLPKGV